VKDVGETCAGDKECSSYNCENGACGLVLGIPSHVAPWEYVITASGIVLLMLTTFIVLFFVHRRQRDRRRAEIAAYWQEQTSYRKSLFALHSANPALSRPGTMYALAPSTPSVTTFADVDSMKGRDGWTRQSDDSRVDLVGGSTGNIDSGSGSESAAPDQGRGKGRRWSPLI